MDVEDDGRIAENVLCEFLQVDDFNEVELNHDDQRIIMIAANFRKEVTSTALWLIEHNIKVKCIKVTPYELDGQILLDTEQIIPITDAEEYLIKVAKKKQEEIKTKEQKQTIVPVRREFWSVLLGAMNEKSTLFSNINPTNDNWISCGSGHGGISYQFVVTREYIRVELWIIGRSKEDNKEIYDCLYEHRETIEEKFENELDWQRLDEGKGSRVGYTLFDVSVLNKDDWQEMIDFAVTYMIKLEKSVKQKLQNVMRILS